MSPSWTFTATGTRVAAAAASPGADKEPLYTRPKPPPPISASLRKSLATRRSSAKEKATSGFRDAADDAPRRRASTSPGFDGSLRSSLRSRSEGLWILGGGLSADKGWLGCSSAKSTQMQIEKK